MWYGCVIGHGIGGKDIPAEMARLAKSKIAGVSNGGALRHLISRPVKSVLARRPLTLMLCIIGNSSRKDIHHLID
jgi:hypothetical protein